ncbi:substrate-binding domain-containing protein [Kallotenue papyrolyticum]|uniref:substrate-binding domain-containing protein n=1 Tax=Kallotenue papyrolyticum TaxID=1325125 RepID=UPI0004709D69|nr:substrate-binding domain-containing protein [Kallotenue papyrolyticum]
MARLSLWLLIALVISGCAPATHSISGARMAETAGTTQMQVDQRLRLATTTSTADSGLLDALLPAFEQQTGASVEVIAVGTGQALKLGERGDVDVVLVHDRQREEAFMAQGFGSLRRDVMYNDFVIVGPIGDPAGVRQAAKAAEAFRRIAEHQALFASRGDDSGTHAREQALWQAAGITPGVEQPWYRSLGQGMGETLIIANELRAYTLSDRGTWLTMRERLPNLALLFGGTTSADNPDVALRNPYGVLLVNPQRHPSINAELGRQFIAWLTTPETQQRIGAFGRERYGQPLFHPANGDE